MSARVSAVCVVLAGAGLYSQELSAHHSQAAFDMSQCVTVSGTVRTLEFQYPHSWLWLIVPNQQGGDDVWGFEFAAPGNLVATDPRWSRTVVKKGDKVSVQFSPIKDGRNAGSMAAMTMADGNTLTVGTPACGGKYSRAAKALRELDQAGAEPPK